MPQKKFDRHDDVLSANHPRRPRSDKIVDDSCTRDRVDLEPGTAFNLLGVMRAVEKISGGPMFSAAISSTSGRALTATALLLAVGCGHSKLIPAPSAARVPGAPGAAFLVLDGIGCSADAQAWQGQAVELPDWVTPVKVRVANSSGRPIGLLYQDFALVGQNGHRYLPIPILPLEPDAQSTRLDPIYASSKFFVAERFHDVYQGVDAWPQPLRRDDDLYETQYRRWGQRPSTDVVRMGMPEGVLGEGGVISGFLYFERPVHENLVTFEAEFDSSESQDTIALVKIPFRVE